MIEIFNNKLDLSYIPFNIFNFFNSLYAYLKINYEPILEINKNIIWLNLFNWIPILILYLGFQIYLFNVKQRYLFGLLISGTFPVIVVLFKVF